MKLDPKGLEAAREQPGTNHDGIIRAYLIALTPAEVGGLVDTLRSMSHDDNTRACVSVNSTVSNDLAKKLFDVLHAARKAATALESQAARIVELEAMKAENEQLRLARPYDGWLYFNPDTGTEWSEQHPVESGEVPDAQSIRPATATNFQNELIPAWEDFAKEKASRARAEAQLAEARKALEPFAMVAEHDIGEDEADSDTYRPMPKPFNHAPQITVGHLRAARRALEGCE